MKRFLTAILLTAMLLPQVSCAMHKERLTASIAGYFDTVTFITAYDDPEAFEEHLNKFEEMLGEYDALYDIYNDADGINNLKTVNDNAGVSPVKVDDRIIQLLKWGKECCEQSGGRVNICFGSVLEIWHEYKEADDGSLPSNNELYDASLHTDINMLIIDEDNSTAYLEDPLMSLDVGAIAKGFASKQICEFAKDKLWENAVISFGGNVVSWGHKKGDGRTPWTILIENPDLEAALGGEDFLTVRLTDRAVVTSGDYQRFFMVEGKRYCHIIDTDTLFPARNFSSVTVICPDPAAADFLSTYLFILDEESGRSLIENLEGTEAVWADPDYNVSFSSGADAYAV